MPAQSGEAIQYDTFDTPGVIVRRLHDDDVEAVAPHVLRIIAQSYGKQFEPHYMPEGTVAQAYDYTDEKRVQSQVTRMRTLMERYDMQYWAAYTDIESHPMGLAKVAPQHSLSRRIIESTSSLLGIDSFARPEVALHDIVVDPAMQKRRIGSFTMHAALSYGGFDPASQVSLDGFEGSPVNTWFSSLGFIQTNKRSMFAVDAEHAIPQQHYVTPEDITLSDVVQNIERSIPGIGYRSL